MEYDKPFKTYDELLEIIESRNIIINNKSFAKDALSDISYYTLINGYKNTFLSLDGTDMFIKGTTFEELYTLHMIDSSLSSILLKYLLYIERSLKSKISYIVSKKYGVYTNFEDISNGDKNDYLYIKNYSNSNNRRKNILQSVKRCAIDDRHNLSLIHYKKTKNHIPPWILIGNVPFGLAIQWYSIFKDEDKTYVCNLFLQTNDLTSENKKELLTKSFSIAKTYRNSLAHGMRTFSGITNDELPKIPLLSAAPSLIYEQEYLAGMGKNDLYAVIEIICLLINDPYQQTAFMEDLNYVFMYYLSKDIRLCGKTILEIFHLPEDIFDRIENYISNQHGAVKHQI